MAPGSWEGPDHWGWMDKVLAEVMSGLLGTASPLQEPRPHWAMATTAPKNLPGHQGEQILGKRDSLPAGPMLPLCPKNTKKAPGVPTQSPARCPLLRRAEPPAGSISRIPSARIFSIPISLRCHQGFWRADTKHLGAAISHKTPSARAPTSSILPALSPSPIPAVNPQSCSQTSPEISARETRRGNSRLSGSINFIFTAPF